MGRPLDAVAMLVGTGADEDVAAAVFELVAAAVASGPVVLVVEDLHWIDAASANLIDRIAQQPWPNLVIIATYRPNDLSRGQPGGELVLRLERRHAVEQVRLDRLDRTEVGAMIAAISLASGGQPSSAFIEALHRRSAGIPFVVEELMRVVGPRPMVADLLDAELPWSLEEAVRQQLAGLAHGRRQVVEALAVYGRSASFEALLVVTEASDADLIDALRSLVDAGVVVEVSDDQFWFSHALVADAIVHQLLGRERRRLHERCFEAVRRAPVLDHASLAYHAQGADRHDEVPGIARRGAARYLEKGLTFSALRLAAEGLSEAPNDSELLAVATEAAWRLDFGAEALETAVRWAKVAVEPLDRIAALRFTSRAPLGARRRAGIRRPPRRARAGLVGARRPPAAGRRRVVAGPGPHDQPPVRRRRHLGRAIPCRRPGRRRHAHRGAGPRRAAPVPASIGSRASEALDSLHEALAAARLAGDAVLLDAGDQQRAGARAVALGRGRRAARRDAGGQLPRRLRQARRRHDPGLGVRGGVRQRRPAAAAPGGDRGVAVLGRRAQLDVVGAGQPGPRGGSDVRCRGGVLGLRRRMPVVEAVALPAPRRRPGRGP